MKKRLTILALVATLLMSKNAMAKTNEDYTTDDFKNSVFEFNYKYTATDRPDDELGPNVSAINKGVIFAIDNGLFITAADNLNKVPAETYSDEVFYTKFEFQSRTISSEKKQTVIIYGFYELVHIDHKRNIAVFKGDDFMNAYATPLSLAAEFNLYSDMIAVGHDEIYNKTKEISNFKGRDLITIDCKLGSESYGSPIISDNGLVVGIILDGSFIDHDNKLVEAYDINLKDLKIVIDKTLSK